MEKTFDDITALYEDYDDLLAAFKAMPKDHEDYEVHKRLINWCNRK